LVIRRPRGKEQSVLRLFANADSAPEQISQLGRNAAGLTWLIMCSHIEIETHESVEKRAALTLIRGLIVAMNEGDFRNTSSELGARPKTINLFSVDFAKMEFIKPFYYGERELQISLMFHS